MNVDNNSNQKVVTYLRHLGLLTEEIDAFLYLSAHGSQTVLALSRGLSTGRTKLYPLLEQLVSKKLVIVTERHYGTSYQAADPSVLQQLVAEHEKRAALLKSDLPDIINTLQNAQPDSIAAETSTDIRQLYWAMSQSPEAKYIIESPAVRKKLGKTFLAKHPVQATSILGSDYEIYIYGNTVSVLTVDSGITVHNKLITSSYLTFFK